MILPEPFLAPSCIKVQEAVRLMKIGTAGGTLVGWERDTVIYRGAIVNAGLRTGSLDRAKRSAMS